MAYKLSKVGQVILGWTVANFIGVTTVGLLSLIQGLVPIRGMLVSSLIIGFPIGFAQWLVLRRIAPISVLWVLTISAGLFLGLLVINSPIPIGFLDFLDDESVLSLTAAFTTIGIIIGLVQWLFLRGHFTKSLVWLLSSAVGFGLGIGLVLASNLIDQSGLISAIIVILVYSTATGLALEWLRGHDDQSHNRLPQAT